MEILDDISRTFNEFLILPGLTKKEHLPENVSLVTPISKFSKGSEPLVSLNIPLTSAAMQAVSGPELAIALARKGGLSFIFCSQDIESQAQMVRQVKEHKAGFVESDSNLPPSATLQDALRLRERTGHSTIAITEDGTAYGRLLGLLTSKDFWEFKDDLSKPVSEFYTPKEQLVYGEEGITLQQATELLWKHKKECLPIVDKEGCLKYLVFRKDYFDHKSNPLELTDANKRLMVGAALNTFDYMERAEALIEAGVDLLVIDSSDGYSEFQKEALLAIREKWGDKVIIGGGNVVSADGFRYLAEEAGADFVKVGIGGGSICITREQKGIGRGQASAVLEVAKERDKYFKETGIYIPICSDGAITNDTHIIIALALGADFVMMGRYFAMTDESPTEKVTYQGRVYKPYWGEGSKRARNWQRYREGKDYLTAFEEGVDAFVPYSGPLSQKVDTTLAKIRAAFCNVGALTMEEFHKKVRLVRVSGLTLVESGTSSVEILQQIGRV
ncbi:MAG: IMP dehydrogenase [Candidatus Dadabacteria bacterium]|nr:MAG: IMP dehydrogenase [Candidatus Dadabacteria bacterium]